MFRAAGARKQDGGHLKSAVSADQGSNASAAPAGDLASLIVQRIALIAADDPERDHKVFRAFLEANLLAEFGEQLLRDPSFATMVDAVHKQMLGDDETAAAVKQSVHLLLSSPSV